MHDLNYNLRFTRSVLFADDTNLLITSKNIGTIKYNIKLDLIYLIDWFKANKLTLNVNKTNCMLFSPNNRTTNHDTFEMLFDDEPLKHKKRM